MTSPTPTPPAWWLPISRALTPVRLAYAAITGAVLWLAWLISISFGSGSLDLAKQVIGTDYIQFYASGLTLRQDNAALLYDFSYQSALEVEIAGPELTNFHAFLTPPFLAWLFVPFSMLPYVWSFIIWSLLSLGGLYASLKILGVKHTRRTYLWTLCWFPVFAAVSFGQNSLLSLLILSLSYITWRRQRSFLSGLITSLMLFKPQLVIGIAILWLVCWRKDWKALLGLLTGGGILAGLTWIFLPEAATNYIQMAIKYLPGMIYQEQFPLYHLHALRGFWTLLLPGMDGLSETISILISLVALGFFIDIVMRSRHRPALSYAAVIAATILITPHAMIYDWVLLLIPAILLWQELPELKLYWRVVFAIIWLITLLSGPITYLQLLVFPVAVQISVPVFIFLLINIIHTLKNRVLLPDPNPPNAG
jgi:alpha-1,2-mannosyltransferase